MNKRNISLWFAALMVGVMVIGCSPQQPAPTASPTPASQPSTSTSEVTTTVKPTSVTTIKRTTTTIDTAAMGREAIAKTLCQVESGVWCTTDPDNPKFVELVSTACQMFDVIDPNHTLLENEVRDKVSLMIAKEQMSGQITADEASSLASTLGAVMGARSLVC